MQQPRCLWLRWGGLVMLAFVLWTPRTATAGQDSIISSSSLLEPPTPVPHTHQYNETLAYQFVDLCGTFLMPVWLYLSWCPCLAYFCVCLSSMFMLHLVLPPPYLPMPSPPPAAPHSTSTSAIFISPLPAAHLTFSLILTPPLHRLRLLLHPRL